MNEQPKTARSYRGTVIDDNAVVSINLKWLGQLLVLVSMLVYGYWRVESRLGQLEKQIADADGTIRDLLNRHSVEEEQERESLENRISFYEKELNLNPFSWKHKRNRK